MNILSLLVCVFIFIHNVVTVTLKYYRGHSMEYGVLPPRHTNTTRSATDVSVTYFWQRLDHFDPANTVVWSQGRLRRLSKASTPLGKYLECLLGKPVDTVRQWIYQTCTEFRYYQTSSQKVQVFGNRFPLDFFIQQCICLFGDTFDETFISRNVEQTNIASGGLDIETSNVVFVQGSFDPSHILGIREAPNPDTPAIFIDGKI
ncbi:hypothetical protein NQ317_000771 [Molorchus minor]|uniref:Uncharacterized protein n=1 Tax=Molorchus minor TaxID=1323400 RepID=A0ABQ9J0N6_9CUCU|nr:hypothetical protein NQ317_000771 [Molorchus minor]